jgi:competence protein ComEA
MKLLNLILALILALFSAVTLAQAIDLNTASAMELEKGLKGIGPSKAGAIVEYREAHGPFTSVNDLTKVPGIKEKTLEKLLADNQNKLTVGGGAAPVTAVTPAKPAMPAVPATPAVPAKPAIPAVPATPAVPAKPAMPAIPATPAVPAKPAIPAVPATPAVPAQLPK